MSNLISRAVMTLAICCFGEDRRDWSTAMRAEFEVAAEDGQAFVFALGCLMSAWRELVTREEGCFTLTSYALALVVIIPMAALQIGCAVFGLAYLYPGQGRLADALLEGRDHEALIRGTYQAAVPSLALLLLLLGIGHLRIAWAMLEEDWTGVRKLGMSALAAAVTLTLLMGVLYLDGRQAILQLAVLTVELMTITAVARWHEQRTVGAVSEHPG